ncbi:MAG: hypothetical protein EZS26_002455 [Candidatus Ordinivivax streblomastigis]|uniref:Uncharacterized protein n=1 Tax=Candidatus Ordinivivax streblomastigis TaxID=2540710 RepID=A0A5M8NYZ5_9BACT|nr:MAG: hypothetical protein EZS26_002455 [Candidatus Ordinivivax streblomastigis]
MPADYGRNQYSMKKQKKQFDSSTFWKKVRFKYKLYFLNENTLEEVFSFRLSLLSGFWAVLSFAILLIILTSLVIINTPIRNYLPGYIDSEIRQEMIENALKTDSLEQIIQVQSLYIENISGIITGNSPIVKITEPDTLAVPAKVEELKKSDALKKFMQKYEEEELNKKK